MSNNYFKNFTDYAKHLGMETYEPGPNPSAYGYGISPNWQKRNKSYKEFKGLEADWKKDREIQNKEFANLKQYETKTVNYGNSISQEADMEASADQARAAAIEEIEKEKLGKGVGRMGKTLLLGGLR